MSAVYLVQRVAFDQDDGGHCYPCYPALWGAPPDRAAPILVPVEAFADRAAAEARRAALEAEARTLVGPLRVRGSRLPTRPAQLDAVLTALGLEPTGLKTAEPDGTERWFRDLDRWWQRQIPKLAPEVIAALWEAFPHPEPIFYHVTETTLED